MKNLRGRRPSGSMVVAFVALIAAGTGTAFAAATITSRDIENNSVRGKDIKRGAIKPSDLSKKLRKQIREGGEDGAQGAPGQQGAQGPPGPAGANGADAVVRVQSLTPDSDGNGPAPPAWGERVSDACGSDTGDADVDEENLRLTVPDGNDFAAADFNGYNGMTLADLSLISYHAKYEQTGTDQHGAMPYFQIYTTASGSDHSVVFTPITQQGADIDAGEWKKFVVTDGTVRYDDDAGVNPDISWEQLINDHGDEEITQIRLNSGCGGGLTAQSVGSADDLTIVAGGTRSVFDFGS